MNTFPAVIVILPKKPIKAPIPLVMTKDPLFLRARTKAAIAEEQKFLPVNATWMYAFELRNFTNLLQQSRQHLMIHAMHLTSWLFCVNFSILDWTYSKMTLIDQITARINAPKAKDPRLYLIDHQSPLERLKLPLVSWVLVKYQVQIPTIIAY